jgi:hypothetical protein
MESTPNGAIHQAKMGYFPLLAGASFNLRDAVGQTHVK